MPTDFNKANRNSLRWFFKLIVRLKKQGNHSSGAVGAWLRLLNNEWWRGRQCLDMEQSSVFCDLDKLPPLQTGASQSPDGTTAKKTCKCHGESQSICAICEHTSSYISEITFEVRFSAHCCIKTFLTLRKINST